MTKVDEHFAALGLEMDAAQAFLNFMRVDESKPEKDRRIAAAVRTYLETRPEGFSCPTPVLVREAFAMPACRYIRGDVLSAVYDERRVLHERLKILRSTLLSDCNSPSSKPLDKKFYGHTVYPPLWHSPNGTTPKPSPLTITDRVAKLEAEVEELRQLTKVLRLATTYDSNPLNIQFREHAENVGRSTGAHYVVNPEGHEE
jgi:hypothetical protein